MKLNGKNGLALVFILLGALILLDFVGLGLGRLMSLIVPVALVGLGYIGTRRGRPIIGWCLIIIGLTALLGKFSGLVGLLIAGAFIYFGYSILKRSSHSI